MIFHFFKYSICRQHGRAKLLAVSTLDEASSIMAAERLHMTHTIKHSLRVPGDSKSTNSILCHLQIYVQLKFVDLKILS